MFGTLSNLGGVDNDTGRCQYIVQVVCIFTVQHVWYQQTFQAQ